MLIRTQDKVPEIYVNDSRDFQLLCRAYDFIFNMVKFDVDSTVDVLSTSNIRNNVLPLLQTKLGFFTPKVLDDYSLRLILEAFSIAMKGKGSLEAIKQAVNVWLKAIHRETTVQISIINDEGGYVGQIPVDPCTVAIGVESNVQDYTALKEFLKYIIPAGFSLYFYFYTLYDVEGSPKLAGLDDMAKLVFVSDDINSVVRNSAWDDNDVYSTSGRSIGSVEKWRTASNPNVPTDTPNTGVTSASWVDGGDNVFIMKYLPDETTTYTLTYSSSEDMWQVSDGSISEYVSLEDCGIAVRGEPVNGDIITVIITVDKSSRIFTTPVSTAAYNSDIQEMRVITDTLVPAAESEDE